MSEFRPTHLSPPGGLSMWTEPDPSQAPVAQLDEGLQVELSILRGSWAEVICSNGFRAWVDGQRLVPLAAPVTAPSATAPPAAAARNRAPLWIGLGAAAIVAVIVAIVALGSGDSGKGSGNNATSTEPTVTLHAPPGWSTSKDGLTVAEDAADLTSERPSGGRVRATIVKGTTSPLDTAGDALDAASDGSIAEEPQQTKVSGLDAASVSVEQNGIRQRVIYVHPPGKAAVVFTLEAPAASFAALDKDLSSVPGLAA